MENYNHKSSFDPSLPYTVPSGGTYGYAYDSDRRLRVGEYPSGKSVEYVYDPNFDRIDHILVNETTHTDTIHITYKTGCPDKIETVSKNGETAAYDYDGSLTIFAAYSGTLNADVGYGYDNGFRLASLAYAGATETFLYDDDGLLESAGDFTITRDPDGLMNGLPDTVSDGTATLDYGFGEYGETVGLAFSVNGATPYRLGLTYYDDGRIHAKTEEIDGVASVLEYTYDARAFST